METTQASHAHQAANPTCKHGVALCCSLPHDGLQSRIDAGKVTCPAHTRPGSLPESWPLHCSVLTAGKGDRQDLLTCWQQEQISLFEEAYLLQHCYAAARSMLGLGPWQGLPKR